MKKQLILLIFATIVILTACNAVSAVSTPSQVSVTQNNVQANQDCKYSDVTPDGRYVAFSSTATNLHPVNNAGTGSQVYVKDRNSGQLYRASRGQGTNVRANGDSNSPQMTPDGRYVAYSSTGTNIHPKNTWGFSQIYVLDGWTGKTYRASVGLNYAQANGNSYNPVISPNGRYVGFQSSATNLIPGGTPAGRYLIYVFDGWTGKTIRCSRGPDGQIPDANCLFPTITPDCRYVAYASSANNIHSKNTHGHRQVYVYDGWTGTTYRASMGLNNAEANGNSVWMAAANSPYHSKISMTPDARYVCFDSQATNLHPVNTAAGRWQVYVYDGWTGKTYRASIAANKSQADNSSYAYGSISANGRYVAFDSFATNLISGITTNTQDNVFVYDGWTGITYLMTLGPAGTGTNLSSEQPVITPDAVYVVFQSNATNLIPGTNGNYQIFLVKR